MTSHLPNMIFSYLPKMIMDERLDHLSMYKNTCTIPNEPCSQILKNGRIKLFALRFMLFYREIELLKKILMSNYVCFLEPNSTSKYTFQG